MKSLRPDYYAKSIFDIDIQFFKEMNIKCILSDLDNTLDCYDVLDPSPRVVELKKKLDEAGIELCIVSNNKEKRKKIYCDRLGIKGKFSCFKPFSNKVLKFIKSLGYSKDEVILIGDQILTDVKCGKNAGIKVILTDPIVSKDQWTTRFNRLFDRPIRNHMRKKGILEGVDITMANKNEFIKLYCFGCGVPLQNDDPTGIGYVPKTLEKNSKYLCQRCFRLQHYGINTEDNPYSLDYKKIIDKARRNRSLIVYVVDLFAFESSIIHSIIEQIKNCRVVIIASKRDVIPTSIKDGKLLKFIKNRMQEYGINPLDIMISSAKNNYNIEQIKNRCNELRKNKDVYIFGATSVGKSSLVNAFLKVFTNNTDEYITTSPYPGTTLDVIKVPLMNSTYIYDTPGILLETSIYKHIDQKLFKYIMPRKEVKPRVYQLNQGQSLFTENIAKFDFIEGEKMNVSIFVSNDLEIYRSKLENSDRVFNNMILNKQFKKISRTVNSLVDLIYHDIILPNNDCDIVIAGLLWYKIKAKGQRIRVWAPKGVEVSVRDCKI